VRGVPSAGQLAADVEGDIDDVDGVLRITRIRLAYRLRADESSREKIDRALANHAEKCPGWQSVRDSIECTWTLELVAGE